MIKNIVFDVGGVLLDFDTRAAARAVVDEEDVERLLWDTIDHPDWAAIDRGMPPEWCAGRMKSRLPERLHAAVDALMAGWTDSLTPDPEINGLALELAEMGKDIYILSNTSAAFYRFRERIPAFPVVKGYILSFEEKLLKPDPEIYRRLLTRFGLAADECFFVDDNYLNMEAAGWCGIRGELYRHDIARLRASLRTAGVPVKA